MNPLALNQIEQITLRIPGVLLDESMSKHTNFRIGGPAKLYVVANDADAMIRAVEAAENAGVPWAVFGGGSNLLVADEGYEGLIVQSGMRSLTVDGGVIHAESGVITALAARKAADASLSGFEWAIGVPGTIGGAVYGNAGCYGGEMKDVVESVDAYRLSDRARVTYTNADCAFAYRESKFKHDRHLIFGCTIRLSSGDTAVSKKRMQEIVETRKEKQPLELSSAGCAFKNFEFSDVSQISVLREKTDVPEAMITNGVISAGWAVERSGARGLTVGGVAVSDKHGNFLVNTGGGTAKDVVELIALVKAKVQVEFGITLENEVQLLGF